MRFAVIFLIVLMLAFASASSYSEQQYRDSFTNWMQKHSRSYASHEFNTRYSVYKKNMDYVNEWNSKGSETVLGLNSLADMTNQEYQAIYLGTKTDATARLAAASASASFGKVQGALPASIDWVAQGAVTQVKNQGQCGSCWSFSATGSTEGAHQISTSNLVALSEQNLIDCSSSYGNDGCNGGLMDNAFKYIIANGGIDTEASYPYVAKVQKCKYNPANSGATLSSYVDVTSGSESALQSQTVKGPVSVAIDASHQSFQLYDSGVYYEPACSSTNLDHGVLVVGYGTASANGSSDSDSSAASQSSSSESSDDQATQGAQFWKVKNSWGPEWGLSGYIQMARNRDNNCGIATTASQPIV
ncbi:cysteine proteinase 5 precursor [Cavenderia fasciculata]|uniref:Cysteine proteinase 5 n=1 Tax=Cavenderia fasciculata TaxID=261658 RepID=F4PRJ8_CACFS|nr:cysteine proteinase 5 precursor [Cavenderia fasciculata]EGG21338.1 cysteine proteinase 5 precursor [Cavenderia fasciculata]|eukprot:XP_004359188.1 cysteine proteinase 5 precursor [Cavenderia fasciculata]